MQALETQILMDEWRGLYKESWKGVIVDEAFAHPAKFSRALIHKIYEHVIAEGWATNGDTVVDPFGGVALGAFPAMQHGLTWYGCELEEKFVTLGNQNIALWNERYSRMPNWGAARLLKGDSRKLAEVLGAAECCVSSPPYAGYDDHGGRATAAERDRRRLARLRPDLSGRFDTCFKGSEEYGDSEGQLGAMKEGDHSLVVTSPPYVATPCRTYPSSTGSREHGRMTEAWNAHQKTAVDGTGYGESEGQLGAMPEGDLCISSPPYNPPMSQDHNGTRGGQRGTTPSEKGAFVKYGNTDGQLEGLSMEGFNAAIASPPFESSLSSGKLSETQLQEMASRGHKPSASGQAADYGATEGNLGNMRGGFEAAISSPPYQGIRQDGAGIALEGQGGFGAYTDEAADQWHTQRDQNNVGNLKTGETFWGASRLILEQLHQVIVPGGHAVFVVKAFVRDKKIVDFPAQWAQLCEAVGFKLLHDHHALLTEHYGTQVGFEEDKKLTVERKSFFRRLAESKGSPRIDHENVLCFERQ